MKIARGTGLGEIGIDLRVAFEAHVELEGIRIVSQKSGRGRKVRRLDTLVTHCGTPSLRGVHRHRPSLGRRAFIVDSKRCQLLSAQEMTLVVHYGLSFEVWRTGDGIDSTRSGDLPIAQPFRRVSVLELAC